MEALNLARAVRYALDTQVNEKPNLAIDMAQNCPASHNP
jgi:hypothetical protein